MNKKLLKNPYFKTRYKAQFIVEQLQPEFETITKHQTVDKPKRRKREKQVKQENQ